MVVLRPEMAPWADATDPRQGEAGYLAGSATHSGTLPHTPGVKVLAPLPSVTPYQSTDSDAPTVAGRPRK
jgi:hypothetical protein